MSRPDLKDKLYYSIREVSEYFEVAPSLLRYWETEFSSIRPKRNDKGTRFYTKKDIAEINQIHLLVKEEGFTLSGAKEKLKKSKSKIEHNAEIANRLREIKHFLAELKQHL